MSFEGLLYEPAQGPLPKWGGGLLVPLVFLAHAVRVLLQGETTLGRRFGIVVHGVDVWIYGAAVLGLALYLHTHYFWGNSERLGTYSAPAKMVSLLLFLVSVLFLAFRVYRPV